MANMRWGGYLGVAIWGVVGLLLLLFSSPAAAQAPIVTPYPGPIATATAAAQQIQQAESNRADGQRLIQLGQEQSATAAAQIQAAQQAANDARAALAAQQYQAALEAVNRAESSVLLAQAQLGAQKQSGSELRSILDAQARQVISLTLEVQQLRTDKQTIMAAYQATAGQVQQLKDTPNVPPGIIAIAVIAFAFLLVVVVILVIEKWKAPTVIRSPHIKVIDDTEENNDSMTSA